MTLFADSYLKSYSMGYGYTYVIGDSDLGTTFEWPVKPNLKDHFSLRIDSETKLDQNTIGMIAQIALDNFYLTNNPQQFTPRQIEEISSRKTILQCIGARYSITAG